MAGVNIGLTGAGEKEEPKFTEKDLVKIAESKNPIATPDGLRESLAAFISQVVVLLHTVKEEEMIAALKYLSPPVEQSDKAVCWFHGNTSFILGIFGGHKAALVQTSKGADCQPDLMPALESLPNAQLIITLGYAYGLKSKCNPGDVLVSTSIDGIGNIRLEHGRLKFDEARVRHTSMSTCALNVFARGTALWTNFICSMEGRKTKVVAGPLISSPVLLNDKAALDEYLKNNERFKGGEMEGQEVARAQLTLKEKDKREVDFIVIKGVADFGDGSKAKGWQLTASLAAASYAEEKLRETGGNVYNSDDTEASSTTPPVAAAQSGSQEEPKFTEEDLVKIAESKTPIATPDDLRDSLAAFISQVVVLLYTVKDEEMMAVLKYLSPPVEQSDKPIRWFHGNASFILGIFGGHKAALVQTSKGADCQRELMPALDSLRNAKLIIILGFAYGLKSKCNLGDVLVSTSIDGIGNFRLEHGRLKFDEGRVRHTSISIRALNVFTKSRSLWRKFICSTEGRKTKVVAGPLISSPVLLSDKAALDEYLKKNERLKGGEMEGQEVARAQLTLKEANNREVDFIIIKGVADLGVGSKAKGWQLTASLAAASYAEEKLRESGGNVYNCSVEEAAMHNRKDLVSIVRRNDFDTAQKILDTQEIDVNAKESDKDGHEWTPLMWAVYNENLKMVELLLRKRANPNEVAKDSNWTSLMFASLKGDLNIAKALLDGGADANAQTIEGVTALAIAIYEHKTEIARLLIDKGAGVHLPDNNGWSPLIYASSYGNLVLVKLICDGGANVCYQTKMGWSSLTLAVAHGHTSVAKELVRRGADLNVLSNTGDAALHLAAGLNYPNIVKELIASGANMEIINKEGMTALMLAAHAGYLDVMEILLQDGANVNGQHKTTGWTAIFIAVWKGKVNIFKRLRHEATVELKGGLNLLDVAIYYNQVEIITELNVQRLVESEKSDEKIIDATRILQSHFYTLEDRYSKLLDNPSKQGYSKLLESPSAENLQESQNVQNNEFIAAVKEAIQKKGTIDHTIVHGLFVGPARSGKDSLIKRLLNEKPPGEISPSTGIAEKVMPVQVNTVECVTAKVDHDQTISLWTRMEYDEEAYDLMIKTSLCYEPDVGHVADDTTESEDVDDTESDTNIQEDDSTNIQAKDVAPLKTPSGDNNSKLSDSASNVESALSSFKDVIRNKGMTGIRKHYEQTWSLYLTNTGGQREFQEILPLIISGPSVFFVTFPLHVNLQDRVLTKYQSSDGEIGDLYLTSPTLIECILQTLATVTAMGTSKQTEQLYQFKSKVFLVGTHKNKLGEASLAETRVDDIDKRIKEIDQQLQKQIRPTIHFTDDLIQFSSKDQMIFTVDNLSDDEEDFVALRSAVERCVLNDGAFANKYPAHWLIFSLVLRHKIQQQIASYDECYSIAQSCGITDEQEFKKALQFIHSTMGIIRYFPYEQDNLKDIVVIDPQILYDLVTDLIVNTFTHDKVGVKKYEDFVHKGIFSHDELVRVTSKRRVGDLLRLERFTTLLTILRMAAPFQDAQGLKKYFLPCALPHAKYQTNEDCHIPEIPPPLLVTFECRYRPMGIAGALIKYLMTNEMNSDIEWELLSDKIFRNEVHLRVGSCDTLRLRFEPTFIEINMLETEVTKRPYLKEKICSEVQQVIQNGIRNISADMKYTSADPIMTFYCNSVRCQQDRHPGVPIKDGKSLASLKCDRYGSIADLPNGYKMWCSDKRTDQQTFTSGTKLFLTHSASYIDAIVNTNVPFVDDHIIECDSSGQEYMFEKHDVIIRIPPGAIPVNLKVHLEAAVMMYTPFSFARNMKPVSPIVWLCFLEESVKLQHPLEVTLPHYLPVKERNRNIHQIEFAKVNHKKPPSRMHYHFESFHGESTTMSEFQGVISTKHCCFLCIQAKHSLQCTLDSWYYLASVKCSRQRILHFCVVHQLKTCVKVIKKQFPEKEGYKVEFSRFKFDKAISEPCLKLYVTSEPESCFGLKPSNAKILANDVDFQSYTLDDLKLMHETRTYPPRVRVSIDNTQGQLKVKVTFDGSTKNSQLDMEDILEASEDHKKATYSEDLVEETSCTQEFYKTVDTGASSNTSLSTTPPMAATQNGSQEEPKYTKEDMDEIADSKNPIAAPDDLRGSLTDFLSKVVVLLHTVKDEEMVAVLKHLSPPIEQSGGRAIRWVDERASLILGIFGGHKAALIQTSKGADCQLELVPALRSLPNAKLIITLGFAYGLKSKCKLGDLLVSTHIDGVGNIRLEPGTMKFDEGRVRQTSMSTCALNVFTKGTALWRSFTCSKNSRKTNVVPGLLISSSMLVNDQHVLDEFFKNNERFKGGEMEGQEVALVQVTLKEQDKREIDFIVIKGVADFGDGTKEKAWQLTASLAASSYAEEKLCESGGRVYKCS